MAASKQTQGSSAGGRGLRRWVVAGIGLATIGLVLAAVAWLAGDRRGAASGAGGVAADVVSSVRGKGGGAAASPAATAPATTAAAATTTPRTGGPRFGFCEGMFHDRRASEAHKREVIGGLDEVGPVMLRGMGQGSNWTAVQPERGRWDVDKIEQVTSGHQHTWLLTLYGRYNYPFGGYSDREARQKRSRRETKEYIRSNEIDMGNPEHRADAEAYVRKLAAQFGDRIRYWELGNEGLTRPNQPELLCATHGWVHDADDDAKTVITPTVGTKAEHYDEQLVRLDEVLREGAADCFDIGNIHYFALTGDDLERRLKAAVVDYREVLSRHGRGDAPIWVTETGTSSSSSSKVSGRSDEMTQARDVVRRLVVLSAAGADKVFWHTYRFGNPDPKYTFHGCTLVEEDGTPKPGLAVFRTLVREIGGATSIEAVRDDGPWIYRAERPGRGTVWIAWARPSTSVDLAKQTGSSTVTVTPLIPAAGAVRVTASPTTASSSSVALSADPVLITAGG